MKHLFTLLAACLVASAAWTQTTVTLTVDMSNESVSADGVHVAGNFQGWDPAATPMTDNGDGTYSHTFTSDTAATYQYKFINGNAWGMDEAVPAECADGIDRYLAIANGDIILEAVCYGTCQTCPGPPLPVDGECAADVNGDGIVSVGDILLVLGEYGCLSGCAFDVDGTEGVGVPDMLVLLAAFGLVCP